MTPNHLPSFKILSGQKTVGLEILEHETELSDILLSAGHSPGVLSKIVLSMLSHCLSGSDNSQKHHFSPPASVQILSTTFHTRHCTLNSLGGKGFGSMALMLVSL